jgi:hypothetical protein
MAMLNPPRVRFPSVAASLGRAVALALQSRCNDMAPNRKGTG